MSVAALCNKHAAEWGIAYEGLHKGLVQTHFSIDMWLAVWL